MPSLIRLYEEFKSSGFVVLAIDMREKKKTVRSYAEKEKLPFPVVMDYDGQVSGFYGVRATPDHFLINKKGEAIGRARGARDWTGVENRSLIRFLLAQ